MSMAAKGQARGARSLDEVLEALATPSGTPAGGTAVALAGAMAAALVELCCRAGGAQAGGDQAAALTACGREANALRARLVSLSARDGAAYRRAEPTVPVAGRCEEEKYGASRIHRHRRDGQAHVPEPAQGRLPAHDLRPASRGGTRGCRRRGRPGGL